MMQYKGYSGKVEYDDEAEIFHGEVIGLPHSSPVNITKIKDDTTSRIVLSTYPTMMNCIDTRKAINAVGGMKRFVKKGYVVAVKPK